MPRIKKLNTVMELISDLKLETIKRAEKLAPELLVLKNDKESEIFRVASAEPGKGKMNKYGISFDTATADGNAVVGIVRTPGAVITNEEIVEEFGGLLLSLKAIEDRNVNETINEYVEGIATFIDEE